MKTGTSIICMLIMMSSCMQMQSMSSKETFPLFPIIRNGDFGYINRYGQTIIPPQFDYAADFFEGLARVKKDGKWSFMNSSGKMVMNLAFPLVYDFQDNFALVQIDRPLKFSDTKFGLINRQGNVVVETSSNAYYNEEDLNISPIYYFLLEKYQNSKVRDKHDISFLKKENLAIQRDSQSIAIVPQNNRTFTSEEGLIFGRFEEGLIAAKEGDYWGFMDETSQWIIDPQFVNFSAPYFSEGLAGVLDPISNQYGYIDKTGEWAIEPNFDEVKAFSEGLASARLSFKWGVLNKKGKIMIPFQFNDELFLFHEGLCKFKRLTKYNYINTKGEIIWEEDFY